LSPLGVMSYFSAFKRFRHPIDRGRFRLILRLVAYNLAIAIAYGITARLSIAFATLPGKVTAVWFPSGLTTALVIWFKASALPGIALGSIAGGLPDLLTMNPPLSASNIIFLNLVFAIANCLQPVSNLAVIQWWTGASPKFNQSRAVVVYILATIVGPALSATLGVTSLCWVQVSPWSSYGTSWVTWCLSSTVANLLFTPPLLLWQQRKQGNQRSHWSEWILISGLCLGLSWITFIQGYPIAYMFLPALIWAVFRLGSFCTSLLVSLISAIAIGSTSQGGGSFTTDSSTQTLLLLQSFIAVCSTTTLTLGAVIQERRVAEVALEEILASLEQKVEKRTAELQESNAIVDGFFAAAPVGLGIVDQHLRYVRVNQLLADLHGIELEHHAGQSIRQLLPDLADKLEAPYQQVLSTGKPILNREETGGFSGQDPEERAWLTSYFPILDLQRWSSKVGMVVMEISDRKQLEAQLKRQARQDQLTAIANRLHFKEASELEWRRCSRNQQSFSVILLDVDEFKRYNDTYGHPAGDTCLIQVAQLLLKAVHRTNDLAARYGGEEFIVMLPETDAAGAFHLANMIRQYLHEQQIPHRSSSVCGYVTASLGVATCVPNLQLKVEDLIQAADQALYESKRQGRDRVTAGTIDRTTLD
jgi:diguanylate cyclase (GGDEF)-like protein/PAS domain S-box-containing protein